MRIGLNALFLNPGAVGGTEIYARHLVHELALLTPTDSLVVYSNYEAFDSWSPLPVNVEVRRCMVLGKRQGLRVAYEQALLPLAARRDGIEVLHSLAYTAPIIVPMASVVTLHDLNYHYHPEDWSFSGLWANRVLIPRIAATATRILTISNSSARAIHEVLGVDPARIDVVYHGVDGNVRPIDSGDARDRVRRFALDGGYLLSVTASHPHKNLAGLLAAYDRYCEATAAPLPLVIVGLAGRDQARLDQAPARARGRVVVTGWVDDADLAALYRSASAFAFASRYEGFGFPVLEAMSIGVPVVTSDATSLGELAEGAAILCDPDDVGGFAEGLRRVTTDETLRRSLVAAGTARAAKFTWRRAAEQTREVYARALAAP